MNPTFRGGIHIAGNKNTRGAAAERMPGPGVVKISLAQHSGQPMRATVSPGDYVYLGQRVGDSEAAVSCPVHSSVSGRVRAIELISDAGRAAPVEAVVIENDGRYTLDPAVVSARENLKPLGELTCDEVTDMLRRAGVVGMGGAVFPAYMKIKSSVGRAKTLLVNCAECEPYITADHRLMLDFPHELLGGIDIVMRAVGCERAIIAVEDNKADAAELLERLTRDRSDIEIRLLRTKYPQGEKSQIIYALTGREPTHGVRLAEIGYLIFNAGTCASIYKACAEAMPQIERIVTVDGDCVASPKNVIAPIGTPITDIIDFCGGLIRTPQKVICGGPMMGEAQWNMSGVVNKATSALLVFSGKAGRTPKSGKAGAAAKLPRRAAVPLPSCCINCGRCVKNCPMRLMPNYLARLSQAKSYGECEKYNISDCMECGCCSYNCPGNVAIVQYIRVAKGALRAAGKR